MSGKHPTKVTLVATVVSMLDEMAFEDIHSEDVLERSGVSKGSLYHHFEAFSDLLSAALVFRFSQEVDIKIDFYSKILASAHSEEELFQGIASVTDATQKIETKGTRLERARVLALSESNPTLAKELAEVQDRLTDAVTELISESINRGFVRPDVDPRSLATFFQAYSLGKVIDDIAGNNVEHDEYMKLLDLVLRSSFAVTRT
jgi:AcrR family transcriptional regulator